MRIEDWKPLGRRLIFTEAKLTGFDYVWESLREKIYKMLLAWKRKEGSGATYQVLYDALCHELVNCKELAEKYCSHCK